METTIPSLRDLMAAGAHFGHKKERSHPKSKVYTYTLREGIYIIDLEKTQQALEVAVKAVAELARSGKTILFVGTKPQAADLVKAAAESAGMPYIVSRWPGGLLTNYETTVQSLKRMRQMEAKLAAENSNLTKKERRVMSENLRKTTQNLGGIQIMTRIPDALFVVDVVAEETAVKEAYRLGIPVIGICDTNANPEKIDFPIPGNDDARKTIETIVNLIAGTILQYKAVTPTEKPVVAEVVVAEKPAEVTAAVEAPAKEAALGVETTEAKPKATRTKKEATTKAKAE